MFRKQPYESLASFMNIPPFFIEPACYVADFDDLHSVRKTVFIDEQHIPADLEFDELDPQCHHFIVRDMQYRPIATARLTPQGKIGRMAVLSPWRGQGVGRSLLHALIDKARCLGLSQVVAHAQLTALGFYERYGFIVSGEVFTEAGLPHRAVNYRIHPIEERERSVKDLRPETVARECLTGLEMTVHATLRVIEQARRRLHLQSRDLDDKLYARADVVEAIKRFVLGNRQATVSILLQEPAALQGQTHPLLTLAQRLPSYFLIQTPLEDEDLQYPSTFMFNDVDGYMFRLLDKRFEGHWSPCLPTQSRELREVFERVWQRSRPCTEFRALGL